MRPVLYLSLMVASFPVTLLVLFVTGQYSVIRDILWFNAFGTIAGIFAVIVMYRELRKPE